MSFAKQLAAKKARLVEIGDEIEAIGKVAESEGRDLSDDDQASIKGLSEEFDQTQGSIENLQLAVDAKDKIASARISTELIRGQEAQTPSGAQTVPAVPARIKSKYFASTLECYQMGKWLGAKLMRQPSAIEFCRQHSIGDFRGAMEGGTDTLGGFTVPQPLMATIIELVEQWGVFRRNARNVPMIANTLDVPRLDGSLSMYYPAENAALTASDLTFGQVNLVAVKYAQLALMSTELNEDSVISMTDLLVRDMARNFAYHEDLNSFTGDGTGTYGGITGIGNALQAGAKVTAGAGANWASVTLGDFQKMAGKLKEYGGISPKWYISRYGYFNAIMDLLNTAGGTDMRQIEEGGALYFMGYPVEITQVLPGESAGANDFVACLGDLDLGAYVGTARQVSIRVLNELFAQNDQIGVMGTMRADSQIHSVGDATDAGAIVGLYLAAV